MILDVVKVFVPAIMAFWVGIALTPLLTHYLYALRAWKKKPGKVDLGGKATPIFNELHRERETATPRMGGIVIWASVVLTVLLLLFADSMLSLPLADKLDFLSREQTWIPLALLVMGALVGLVDDILEVRATETVSKGLSLKVRLFAVAVLAFAAGWWFYAKLGVTTIGIPFGAPLMVGWLVIPLFVVVTLFIYASGIIDGIDGLAGGVFASIFSAYAGIAFFQHQIDLAAFSAAVSGGTLAFLWFNVPPARFYMSETGTMGLTLALAAVAFMTDAPGGGHGLLALPVVAFPLVITVLSTIIQVLSKRFRNGKKIFKVAPLHHHFEAIGWPPYKVTMRYWILSLVFALAGVAFALVG
jgi:phospho-N-acetylmuramoyl-pentapeptide-transferase